MKIDWQKIKTAHGTAAHIPAAVKLLASAQQSQREAAYWQLDNYVVLQSDLHEAAYYTIDLLISLLEEPYTVNRNEPLELLYEIAAGGNGQDEMMLNDKEPVIKMSIYEACKTKMVNFKNQISEIVVKTQAEKEQLEAIIDIINMN